MIQARKLGHVVLKVRDAQKSKEFYIRALGLKVANDARDRGAVFLSFGTQHHDLALFQLATGEAPDSAQLWYLIVQTPRVLFPVEVR